MHRVGDKIVIDGPKIIKERTDALCVHALSVLLHYVVALDHGVDPVLLGLTKPEEKEHAYVSALIRTSLTRTAARQSSGSEGLRVKRTLNACKRSPTANKLASPELLFASVRFRYDIYRKREL